MNHAAHSGNKPRTDASRGGQAGEWYMILREEVEMTGRAFEDAQVPIAVLFQTSRRLDHRSTAVRASGGFGHSTKPSALVPLMFRFLPVDA